MLARTSGASETSVPAGMYVANKASRPRRHGSQPAADRVVVDPQQVRHVLRVLGQPGG
jgi:hypothetical protein